MKRTSLINVIPPNLNRGFSMVEVLVTLVLIAVALLGTAGLQAYAMRMSKSGEFRTHAVFLAADIAERMEANKIGAVAGAYRLPGSSVAPALSTGCETGACAPTALAAYDLSQWQNAVTGLLPQSSWRILISQDNCNSFVTTVTDPITYCIVVSWVDRRSNTTYDTAGTGETFSHSSRRMIRDATTP